VAQALRRHRGDELRPALGDAPPGLSADPAALWLARRSAFALPALPACPPFPDASLDDHLDARFVAEGAT